MVTPHNRRVIFNVKSASKVKQGKGGISGVLRNNRRESLCSFFGSAGHVESKKRGVGGWDALRFIQRIFFREFGSFKVTHKSLLSGHLRTVKLHGDCCWS